MTKKRRLLDAEVAEFLTTKFFLRNQETMRKSPVWVALRDGLRAKGNWKYAPRGNPRKGFARQQETKDRVDDAAVVAEQPTNQTEQVSQPTIGGENAGQQ